MKKVLIFSILILLMFTACKKEEIVIDIDKTNEWGSIGGWNEELSGNDIWEAL